MYDISYWENVSYTAEEIELAKRELEAYPSPKNLPASTEEE